MMNHDLKLLLLILLHACAVVVTPFTYREASAKARSKKASVYFPSEQLRPPPPSPLLFWARKKNDAMSIFYRGCRSLVLRATGGGRGGGGGKKGYKFGDITKSLIGGSVEKITGKPYEFGDLSRAIDSSIKNKVSDLTGKDDYEFGDLSRWVDGQIKGEVNKFTQKDSYQFGDLSKEILRRVAAGQYTLNDLYMLLKAIGIFGASISPVAGFFPVKLLVDLLNFSLLNDVAGKVTSALAMELDRRLKKSLLGDEDYKLGDATKRTIANAVQNYTGKDTYEFGDVTKKVVSNFADDKAAAGDRRTIGMRSAKDMEPGVLEALDRWDSLSEKQLQSGLDKIEEYVELIEMEQRAKEKK